MNFKREAESLAKRIFKLPHDQRIRILECELDEIYQKGYKAAQYDLRAALGICDTMQGLGLVDRDG